MVRSLLFERGDKPTDLARTPDGRLIVSFDDGSKGGSFRVFRPF